ncbi:MAG: glycosyltransferase, partial [Chloroflexota bacterium]
MNILMFSMTPLFPDRAMGGAQIQLKKVARHLGALGHEVTILCTRKDASMIPFNWDDTVRIVPVLRFKQPYPEPYATPVYNIAAAVQDVGAYLLKADRFYSHDGGLIFPFVYQTGAVPTVISLRSILFAETLQSAYLFQGDALILPSEHTRRSYIHTAGRFFPGFAERAVAVHNGLDFTVFRPTEPDRIRALIPVDTAQHRCLLFPHRPDTTKGVLEAIGVLDVLVNRRGMTDVRLLMPRWLADAAGPEVRAFY